MSPEHQFGERKVILAVDDEPSNLELIRMLVDDADLPVTLVTAQDGMEAVRLTREHRPALVLMDLKMPVLDGLEATRRLKADASTAPIPIVALTAQAMVGDVERAGAAGCDGYVTKPIDTRELLRVMQDYCR